MYKKGDIVVCSNNRNKHGVGYSDIIIGDKYEVTDCLNFKEGGRISMSDGDVALFVKHTKSGKEYSFVPSRLFIPLSVYREFQLRNVLD